MSKGSITKKEISAPGKGIRENRKEKKKSVVD
jgi:hypothetical protein